MELSKTQMIEDVSVLGMVAMFIIMDQIIGLETLCPFSIFGMNLAHWLLLFFIILIPAFVIGDLLTGRKRLKTPVEKIRRDTTTLYGISKEVIFELFKNLGKYAKRILRINVITNKKKTLLTPKELITQIIDRKNASSSAKRNIVFATKSRMVQSTVQDRVPIKIIEPQLLRSSRGFMPENGVRGINIIDYMFLSFLIMVTILLVQFL